MLDTQAQRRTWIEPRFLVFFLFLHFRNIYAFGLAAGFKILSFFAKEESQRRTRVIWIVMTLVHGAHIVHFQRFVDDLTFSSCSAASTFINLLNLNFKLKTSFSAWSTDANVVVRSAGRLTFWWFIFKIIFADYSIKRICVACRSMKVARFLTFAYHWWTICFTQHWRNMLFFFWFYHMNYRFTLASSKLLL